MEKGRKMRISEKTPEDIARDEAEEARREAKRQAKEQIALSGLKEKTYPEVVSWINEITDLPSAKQKLKVICKILLAVIKYLDV